MNIEIMRKHYERTPKETLINVLVASREQVDKLQKRNKELKQEIERLKELCDKYEEEHKTTFEEWKKTINIIKEVREYITSYESIETIQQFDHNKNNEDLDYSTIDEMTRRYMMVHDKILKILDKEGK